MVMPAAGNEVHPTEFVTVNEYVLGTNPETTVLAPDPAIVPGLIVQLPAGNPLMATLPVDTAHVGCVIVPVIGAAGVKGCELITTSAVTRDIHPEAVVIV